MFNNRLTPIDVIKIKESHVFCAHVNHWQIDSEDRILATLTEFAHYNIIIRGESVLHGLKDYMCNNYYNSL
jgi:hypothetical protein